ncbi:MAG: protein phosphatase 2C domain-containing protein [Simkaniaceae bacterium]
MLQKTFSISSYGGTDIGYVRKLNEDFWGYLKDRPFYALADGMGGHLAGEIASKQTVDYLLKAIDELFTESQKKWRIKELASMTRLLVENANTLIYNLGIKHQHLKGMGTTLCTLHFHENQLIYSHVGDSRIYRFRKNELKQLTSDHSKQIEEKIKALKNIKRTRRVLTRAIGPLRDVDVEVQTEKIKENDLYLMCSDGLTTHLSEFEIQEVLNKKFNLQELTSELIQSAKLKGGRDNITVVLAKVMNSEYEKKTLFRLQRNHSPSSKSY